MIGNDGWNWIDCRPVCSGCIEEKGRMSARFGENCMIVDGLGAASSPGGNGRVPDHESCGEDQDCSGASELVPIPGTDGRSPSEGKPLSDLSGCIPAWIGVCGNIC